MTGELRNAPVLHEVAAALAGKPPATFVSDPVGWAYAVAEAVTVAQADWAISHFAPALELRAAAGLARHGGTEALAELPGQPVIAAAAQAVTTLSGLYRAGRPVAATLTGPRKLVTGLGSAIPAPEVPDAALILADAVAACAVRYAEAGANAVVVWEEGDAALLDAAARALSLPEVRLLALTGPGGRPAPTGVTVVRRWAGGAPPDPGVIALPASFWHDRRSAPRWERLRARPASGELICLSQTALPATTDPAILHAAGTAAHEPELT